jgi:hypothetical protein
MPVLSARSPTVRRRAEDVPPKRTRDRTTDGAGRICHPPPYRSATLPYILYNSGVSESHSSYFKNRPSTGMLASANHEVKHGEEQGPDAGNVAVLAPWRYFPVPRVPRAPNDGETPLPPLPIPGTSSESLTLPDRLGERPTPSVSRCEAVCVCFDAACEPAYSDCSTRTKAPARKAVPPPIGATVTQLPSGAVSARNGGTT